MEGLRRFAFGRLAELVGPAALELDRAARRLRLCWAAEQDVDAMDPETREIAERYCDGVNAFIETGPRRFVPRPRPGAVRAAPAAPAPGAVPPGGCSRAGTVVRHLPLRNRGGRVRAVAA